MTTPIFTPEQLTAFYDRISLPLQHRHAPFSSELTKTLACPSQSLDFLSALVLHTLASIPFENLALHYSPHRTVNIDPQYLFDKMVRQPHNGRGGYCMENNGLMHAVLKSLGFDVASVGGQVNESTGFDDGKKAYGELRYLGWNHMVNIVYLPAADKDKDGDEEEEEEEQEAYLVDVGFGGGGPSKPVRLRHSETVLNMPSAASASTFEDEGQIIRLVREVPPGLSARGHRRREQVNERWVYQRRMQKKKNGQEEETITRKNEFRPFYSFTEMEFLPADYRVMNHWASTSKSIFFTWEVMCVRKILDEGETRVIGELTLHNDSLKRRVYGENEFEVIFKSEEERVAALKKYFGIELKEYEKNAILGTASAIKG